MQPNVCFSKPFPQQPDGPLSASSSDLCRDGPGRLRLAISRRAALPPRSGVRQFGDLGLAHGTGRRAFGCCGARLVCLSSALLSISVRDQRRSREAAGKAKLPSRRLNPKMAVRAPWSRKQYASARLREADAEHGDQNSFDRSLVGLHRIVEVEFLQQSEAAQIIERCELVWNTP